MSRLRSSEEMEVDMTRLLARILLVRSVDRKFSRLDA